MRWLWCVLLAACGESEPRAPLFRWQLPGDFAPPALGPEGRVVVLDRAGLTVRTVDQRDASDIEAPVPSFASDHAPIMVGAEIYLVSTVGKVVRMNLVGDALGSTANLGRTGPLSAANGQFWIAASSGTLHRYAADLMDTFSVALGGVADSALSLGERTYAATDLGRVVGVDAAGNVAFDVQVAAPASGPSAHNNRVAVGALDAVVVFDATGSEVWRRARAARVVGTQFVGEDLLAWGEDGQLVRYGPAGEERYVFRAGPPIYAPVVVFNDKTAVFDSAGNAHLLDSAGQKLAELTLGGTLSRQIVRAPNGLVVLSTGERMVAIDFEPPQ